MSTQSIQQWKLSAARHHGARVQVRRPMAAAISPQSRSLAHTRNNQIAHQLRIELIQQESRATGNYQKEKRTVMPGICKTLTPCYVIARCFHFENAALSLRKPRQHFHPRLFGAPLNIPAPVSRHPPPPQHNRLPSTFERLLCRVWPGDQRNASADGRAALLCISRRRRLGFEFRRLRRASRACVASSAPFPLLPHTHGDV